MNSSLANAKLCMETKHPASTLKGPSATMAATRPETFPLQLVALVGTPPEAWTPLACPPNPIKAKEMPPRTTIAWRRATPQPAATFHPSNSAFHRKPQHHQPATKATPAACQSRPPHLLGVVWVPSGADPRRIRVLRKALTNARRRRCTALAPAITIRAPNVLHLQIQTPTILSKKTTQTRV